MTIDASIFGRVIAIASCLLALPIAAAGQDEFPGKAVRIIVPFPAGTVADIFPRIIAPRLAERWKQPVIVENRVGASGNVGAEALFHAEPDGHTLLASPPPPLVVNHNLFTKLAFDPGSFVPVSVLCRVPNVLVVRPLVPAATVEELLALARADPDRLNYASTGNGGTPHLTSEHFKSVTGARMVHVPYSGLSQAVGDLLGGQVDLMFAPLPGVAQHMKAGRLKALAVGGRSRIAEFPSLPTLEETLPGFISDTWYALVAPPRTPARIAATISADIREVLAMPEVIDKFRQLSAIPDGASPQATADLLEQEARRWREVIRANGIKPD
jgi:tripartite-type tricarboxylate transporter receptor subunit TctC